MSYAGPVGVAEPARHVAASVDPQRHGVSWNVAAHCDVKMVLRVWRQTWVSVSLDDARTVLHDVPSGRAPVNFVLVPVVSSQEPPSWAGSRQPLSVAHERQVEPWAVRHAAVVLPMPHWLTVTHGLVALQVWPVAQGLGQATGLPQLASVDPQGLRAQGFAAGMQPHVPGDPAVPLQVAGAAQAGTHVMVPPQLSEIEPQVFIPQAVAFETGVQPHVPAVPPAPLQVAGETQLPQFTVLPQPSGALPHKLVPVPQAAATVFGVQTQVPGAPLQDVCGAVQLPQVTVPPQPSETLPQVLVPHACATVLATQPQVFGLAPVLLQVCGAVQPGVQVSVAQ